MPSTYGIEDDDELRSQYLVKVLADGLWMHDREQALTQNNVKLTDHILQMLEKMY